MNGNLYFFHSKTQILTKDNDLSQMMHNLEFINTYYTNISKKITHNTL